MEVEGIEVTHPDRVLYPDQGITKVELARYYARVAPLMLPHVANRPLVLVRCPEGQERQCFFQRHWSGSVPEPLESVMVKQADGARKPHVVVREVGGLVTLVQHGILEIHAWNARADNLEAPDRIVFDLDPGPSVPWTEVRRAARLVRERLEEAGLESWLKVSGGKGLHVVTPIGRGRPWSDVADFARGLAERLARDEPKRFVATMAKAARKGRVFIDWLRNVRGASAVAAWSTRARPGAPISMPWPWARLDDLEDGGTATVASIRTGRLPRPDPWAGLLASRQRLTAAMLRAVAGGKT